MDEEYKEACFHVMLRVVKPGAESPPAAEVYRCGGLAVDCYDVVRGSLREQFPYLSEKQLGELQWWADSGHRGFSFDIQSGDREVELPPWMVGESESEGADGRFPWEECPRILQQMLDCPRPPRSDENDRREGAYKLDIALRLLPPGKGIAWHAGVMTPLQLTVLEGQTLEEALPFLTSTQVGVLRGMMDDGANVRHYPRTDVVHLPWWMVGRTEKMYTGTGCYTKEEEINILRQMLDCIPPPGV